MEQKTIASVSLHSAAGSALTANIQVLELNHIRDHPPMSRFS